mmetsp:Transcript_32282/g.60297  ORF Transcript_32282/g.60297 Transcript_32282/m.60297 type:complete len:379 (-) Transcript_32282:115-1251(-)
MVVRSVPTTTLASVVHFPFASESNPSQSIDASPLQRFCSIRIDTTGTIDDSAQSIDVSQGHHTTTQWQAQPGAFPDQKTLSTASCSGIAFSTASTQSDINNDGSQSSDVSPLHRVATPWRPRSRPSSFVEPRTLSVESDTSVESSAASTTSTDMEDNSHPTSFNGLRRAATPWRPRRSLSSGSDASEVTGSSSHDSSPQMEDNLHPTSFNGLRRAATPWRPRRSLSSGSDASEVTGSSSRDSSPQRGLQSRTWSVSSSASTACTESDLDDSQRRKKHRHVEVLYTDEPGRIEIIEVAYIDYSMIGEDWKANLHRGRYKEVLSAKMQSRSRGQQKSDNKYCNLAEIDRSCDAWKTWKKTEKYSSAGARASFKDRSHQQR